MVWTEKHDMLLCREIITTDPFTDIKKGTTQRSAKWAAIACSLNLPFLHFHATISSNNSNTTTSDH